MANWCKNELTVSGNGLELIKDKYINEHSFDFNSIIKLEGVGEAAEKWGTKWRPENLKIIDEKICFETAWSPPCGILKKLAELHKDYKFELDYFSQESEYGGKATAEWKDGKVLFEDKYEELDVFLPFTVQNLNEYKENIAFMEQQQEPSQTPPEPAQAQKWDNNVLECKLGDYPVKFELKDHSDFSYGAVSDNFTIMGDIDTTKKLVENAINHFDKKQNVDFFSVSDFFSENMKELWQKNDQQQQTHNPDRQLEAAQKTGYVQGVCESVLAFNTDENRKIMSESAMALLSKKIISEMNVTKDMAQKYAHPETYKALEQCLFTPKQEQKLEQTQSFKR